MKMLARLFEIDVEKMTPFDRQVIASMNMDSEKWGLSTNGATHPDFGDFVWMPIRGFQLMEPAGLSRSPRFRKLSWRGKRAFGRKHWDMLQSEVPDRNTVGNVAAGISAQTIRTSIPASPITASGIQMLMDQRTALMQDLEKRFATHGTITSDMRDKMEAVDKLETAIGRSAQQAANPPVSLAQVQAALGASIGPEEARQAQLRRLREDARMQAIQMENQMNALGTLGGSGG